MFAFVPVFFFIVVYLFFIKSKLFDDCRSSFLAVFVAWGVLVPVIIEFLSKFSSIGFPQLLFVWSILTDASPNKVILNEIAYDRVWMSIPITIYQPK